MRINLMYAQAYKAFLIEKHKKGIKEGEPACTFSHESNGCGCAIGVNLSEQMAEEFDQYSCGVWNLYTFSYQSSEKVQTFFDKIFDANPEFQQSELVKALSQLQTWHDEEFNPNDLNHAEVTFQSLCLSEKINYFEVTKLANSLPVGVYQYVV